MASTGTAVRHEAVPELLGRAFRAGVPAAWGTGDEVYGGDGDPRRWLEREKKPYVLAVRGNQARPVASATSCSALTCACWSWYFCCSACC